MRASKGTPILIAQMYLYTFCELKIRLGVAEFCTVHSMSVVVVVVQFDWCLRLGYMAIVECFEMSFPTWGIHGMQGTQGKGDDRSIRGSSCLRYYNSTNVFLYNSSLIYASERYVLRLEPRMYASDSCWGLKGRVSSNFPRNFVPSLRPDTSSTYSGPISSRGLPYLKISDISYTK
jgi:hypothetical protein